MSRQSGGGAIGDGAVAATIIGDGATATAVIGVGAAVDGGGGKPFKLRTGIIETERTPAATLAKAEEPAIPTYDN